MKRKNNFLKVLNQSIKMYASAELEYRLQLISWIISSSLYPLILAFVWNGSARSASSTFNSTDVFSYFLALTIVNQMTKDWSDRYMSDKIISGQFSSYLSKPYNYLSEMMGISIGSKLTRVLFTFPFIIIIGLLVSKNLSYDFSILNILLTIVSLGIAFAINFFMGNIFALFAFFFKQMIGFRTFYENLIVFMSGEILPIFTLSPLIRQYFEILPFRFGLSFPIEILMGVTKGNDMLVGFLLSLIWLGGLYFIFKLLFKIAIKKYEGEGI